MQTRIIIRVSGKVQGVFFRQFVKEKADKLKLKGLVRNLTDKNIIEVIAEGEEEDLRVLLKTCEEGPKHAQIENVNAYYDNATGEFENFRIVF